MPADETLTTARIATTPTQAKLFVALLEAEGIRAYVEGDSLADQVAISQRLMNTAGTHVRVRADELERAQEVLAEVPMAPGELETLALAAKPDDGEVSPKESAPIPFWVFVLVAAAVIGVIAWNYLS